MKDCFSSSRVVFGIISSSTRGYDLISIILSQDMIPVVNNRIVPFHGWLRKRREEFLRSSSIII